MKQRDPYEASFEIEDEREFHIRWDRVLVGLVVLAAVGYVLISGGWRAEKTDTRTAWQHGYDGAFFDNLHRERGIFIDLEASCAKDAQWSVQDARSEYGDTPWTVNLKKPGAEAEYIQGCIAARKYMVHVLHDRMSWGVPDSADKAIAQAELKTP